MTVSWSEPVLLPPFDSGTELDESATTPPYQVPAAVPADTRPEQLMVFVPPAAMLPEEQLSMKVSLLLMVVSAESLSWFWKVPVAVPPVLASTTEQVSVLPAVTEEGQLTLLTTTSAAVTWPMTVSWSEPVLLLLFDSATELDESATTPAYQAPAWVPADTRPEQLMVLVPLAAMLEEEQLSMRVSLLLMVVSAESLSWFWKVPVAVPPVLASTTEQVSVLPAVTEEGQLTLLTTTSAGAGGGHSARLDWYVSTVT